MLANLSLRNKFLITTIISISLLGSLVILISRPMLEHKLFSTIVQRGISIARSVSFNTEHYILEEQYLILNLILKDYQSHEDDIAYIFVEGSDGQILAHTFDDGFPGDLLKVNEISGDSDHSIKHLLTEDGEILDIAVPVLKKHAGSLHVGISGEEARRDTTSFVRWVMGLIVATLAAVGALSVLASRLITHPLGEMAKAARKVAGGDLNSRVPVSSSDEIGQLKTVFNDMVEKRQQREKEREKLIAELHMALDEVKALSGMLPICSACKKIRDDKGYWNQIETYIRDHSEAEFTHGICPDCAKELYGDFFRKNDTPSNKS